MLIKHLQEPVKHFPKLDQKHFPLSSMQIICFAPRVGVRSFSLYHMGKPLVSDSILNPSIFQSGTIRQAGLRGLTSYARPEGARRTRLQQLLILFLKGEKAMKERTVTITINPKGETMYHVEKIKRAENSDMAYAYYQHGLDMIHFFNIYEIIKEEEKSELSEILNKAFKEFHNK